MTELLDGCFYTVLCANMDTRFHAILAVLIALILGKRTQEVRSYSTWLFGCRLFRDTPTSRRKPFYNIYCEFAQIVSTTDLETRIKNPMVTGTDFYAFWDAFTCWCTAMLHHQKERFEPFSIFLSQTLENRAPLAIQVSEGCLDAVYKCAVTKNSMPKNEGRQVTLWYRNSNVPLKFHMHKNWATLCTLWTALFRLNKIVYDELKPDPLALGTPRAPSAAEMRQCFEKIVLPVFRNLIDFYNQVGAKKKNGQPRSLPMWVCKDYFSDFDSLFAPC